MTAPAVLFRNARILDATGREPFAGDVLVRGNRVAEVAAEGASALAAGGALAVDCGGATLMPGLIESHAHLSFADAARSVEMGFIPPEEHMLLTVRNAGKMLDQGFTSCFSAASAKPRLDVVLRNAVNAGEFPGPRLLAASPELTVTAGLGDVRLGHMYRENFAIVCDGADMFRRVAREMVREGVDTLKINVSGDAGTRASPARTTVVTEAELDAVCEVARAHEKRVAAHARSAVAVKLCVKHGVDVIYHATLCDDDALAALESARDRVFVAPTLGHLYATLHEAKPWGVPDSPAAARVLEEELAAGIQAMKALVQRGVRVLPGGDYGFAWNPIGANARDIAHFVELLGMPPMQAIVAATRLGAELMGLGGELGTIRAGQLADLIVVEGDPLADPAVLRDRGRIVAVMKDGHFHRHSLRAAR